ncbi:quinoprotein dehydrogenase-associated SoxYZ-like carrier [Actibacterium lipolyticum]|uniref:Sulfur oxidation protein SoxY n=1 Tax=Actibacterium lipolyticum TaxID=1524263 RepID=A0A238JNW7_9RHOB|nr:quinoprotein dehydrogenase-associated SoxYZ-like carrier [Actibacterium lipolyticum]SMX32369.1 sulfur oxidation protein SoxY [Actibacterium lipolyticum]
MKILVAATFAALISQPVFATEVIDNPLTDTGSWTELREDLIGDVTLADGATLFTVDAPYRAHDAATVPIVIRQTDLTAAPITSAMVVIDENPAPMAADMTFGPAMAPLNFELRVRVNQYSNVRVIATTTDGDFMNGRFVKASGGCSAPATKDPSLALNSMGQMRLKHFGDTPQMSTPRREAQIMIRHPNYSGLQRDQITQLFISAHFIDKLEVFQGDEMLFTLEGGISVSENPVFRFDYTDNGDPAFRVRAQDTEGNVFEQTLPKNAQS